MPVVTSVNRNDFKQSYLNVFWQFLTERQRVWWRRSVDEQEFPWTRDRILQSEFFTNVYRELDQGSQYVVRRILSKKGTPDQKMFTIMLYRTMGSSISIASKLGLLDPETFDREDFIKSVNLASNDVEDPAVFEQSYRVASMGTGSKVENIGSMFTKISEEWDELKQRLDYATSVRSLFDALVEVQGFGEFLAYQIALDLTYESKKGRKLYDFDRDEWAMAGPGAKKGIWKLMASDVRPNSMMVVIRWLVDNQQDEFERLELEFPYITDKEGSPVWLDAANMQACLCEFLKFSRIWDGEKNSVRKYRPSEQTPSQELWVPPWLDENLWDFGDESVITQKPSPSEVEANSSKKSTGSKQKAKRSGPRRDAIPSFQAEGEFVILTNETAEALYEGLTKSRIFLERFEYARDYLEGGSQGESELLETVRDAHARMANALNVDEDLEEDDEEE